MVRACFTAVARPARNALLLLLLLVSLCVKGGRGKLKATNSRVLLIPVPELLSSVPSPSVFCAEGFRFCDALDPLAMIPSIVVGR